MNIKKATLAIFNDFFELRKEPRNIIWTGHKNPPDYEKLKHWFINTLRRDDRLFFIIYNKERPAGYLYMDIVGENNDTIEIGYSVDTKFSKLNYGSKIISFAIEYADNNLPNIHFHQAWVAFNNIASIKNVLKSGYVKTKETKIKTFEKNGEQILFEMYLYKSLTKFSLKNELYIKYKHEYQ